MLKSMLLSLLLLAAPVTAFAEDTGWMMGSDWPEKSRELNRRGMLLTKIECKDSTREGLGMDSAQVRVFYEPNTKGMRWWWVGDTNLKHTRLEYEERGYHLVSNESFVRSKTGVRIYCLLFHKPKGQGW